MKNPLIASRSPMLAYIPVLFSGAVLPAAAQAAPALAEQAEPGALVTLGIGLLLLLLRPRAPQPAYDLFARDLDAQAAMPQVHHQHQPAHYPQHAEAPLAA